MFRRHVSWSAKAHGAGARKIVWPVLAHLIPTALVNHQGDVIHLSPPPRAKFCIQQDIAVGEGAVSWRQRGPVLVRRAARQTQARIKPQRAVIVQEIPGPHGGVEQHIVFDIQKAFREAFDAIKR